MGVHQCTMFTQYGAPCLRSKEATDFLKKNNIFVLGSKSHLEDMDYTEKVLYCVVLRLFAEIY